MPFRISTTPIAVIVMLLTLLHSSCANRKIAKNTIELEPIDVSARNSSLYRASATQVWDIEHTKVALSFDWKRKTADGQAWITLHPYFYPTDTLVLDAKSMRVDSVMMMQNGSLVPVKFTFGDSIKIRFERTYTAKDTITLYVKYKAMPYAEPVGGSAAISEDRGLYFINTDYSIPGKPAQIWTQGETEANSHWMPTIDKPNNRFTFELSLTVPDSFVTLSNGRLKSQQKAGNMRTDNWAIDQPIQAYAAMFAIGKFFVLKQDWIGKGQKGFKALTYYVEPEYRQYAFQMFKHTPEMMNFFTDITDVPYPWDKYSQVVVRDYVSGAMENTSASLFGEFMNQNNRENKDRDYESIVAHELFHQWFGDYVTFESWSNLTVSESFANYGEQLWFRHKYGNAKADIHDFEELQQYLGQAQTSDVPLVRFHYDDKEKMFDRISYQKGGAILHYLHGLMGDEAFYKAMNLYLTKNALQSTEASHWRYAVEEVTGQDWNWFFNQWYYRGGHPELNIKYEYDDVAQQLRVAVTQTQDSGLYILPLKADVAYGTEMTSIDWELRKKKEVFIYPYKNGAAPLLIPDTKHWLVGAMSEDKKPAKWLQQFVLSGDNILNKLNAMIGVRKGLDDTAVQKIYSLALQDKQPYIREYALQMIKAYAKGKKWEDKWRSDVTFMATNDGDIHVRTAAFELLGIWKVKAAKEDMLQAVYDSSYAVAGAALIALNDLKEDTVYGLAKSLALTDPKANLQAAIWEVIAERGKAEDQTIFAKDAPHAYGGGKISLADAMNIYLRNVKEVTAFEGTLELYLKLVRDEPIGVYRSGMAGSFVETANFYKKQVQDANTNAAKAEAQQKFDLLRKASVRVLSDEKDETNRKQYRPYIKKIFGE